MKNTIKNLRTYISVLSKIDIENKDKKINTAYEQAVDLAIKNHICYDVIFDYAKYLASQGEKEKAISMLKKLKTLYDKNNNKLKVINSFLIMLTH